MFNIKEYLIKNREKINKQRKEYRIKNREKIREYNKQYCIDNKEKVKEICNKWRKNNREYLKEYTKQFRKDNPEYSKRWREDNSKRVTEYSRQYMGLRRKTDLKFNLNLKISNTIRSSLISNKNGWHWEDLVGYTLNTLVKRLNKTMPQSYTWKHYLEGKLHIDHIIPIRAFTFKTPEDEEFKDCWSLYNLRLLPAIDNKIKKDNITNPILLMLLLGS